MQFSAGAEPTSKRDRGEVILTKYTLIKNVFKKVSEFCKIET